MTKRISSIVRRSLCNLPDETKSLCDMGCIYRDKAHRHMACYLGVQSYNCVAPCNTEFCQCNPPPNKNGTTEVKVIELR